VLLAVVERDPTSYLRLQPEWSPVPRGEDRFGLVDLLHLA
jgi:hypothetical protein